MNYLPMENGNDLSSSLSFASSSLLSNGYCVDNAPPCEVTTSPELLSLRKLSSNLEKLVVDAEYHSYCDAEIEVEGISVGVHRCILASRSRFFHELFKKDSNVSTKEGKPKYLMSQLVPPGRIGYDVFMTVLNYLYTGGKVKDTPADVATCVDESCAHDACGPAIQYAVEMMYASSKFEIEELVHLVQRGLLNFVMKAFAEDVIPILMVAYHCNLKELLSHCTQKIAMSDLDDVIIEKELPYEVIPDVKSIRINSKQEEEHDSVQMRVKKIHKALDSNDIDLVKLLLDESNISLDVACALHYASAYCNPKIVTEVLNLGNANVNHQNSRGYTVLHVAARRKDLSVIVELLSRGASASDTTLDGRTALTICKRLTRPKDCSEETRQGQEKNKDRLCIEVLKRESQRIPLAGNILVTSIVVADDLYMKLLLLENRVAMARTFFPIEARVAMHTADAASTFEFSGLAASKGLHGNFGEDVILSEIPSEQVKKLQRRLQALEKTVETGRRFFPSCSEFLDKLLEDDTVGSHMLERGTSDERAKKHNRYTELMGELMDAFNKDMAAKKKLVTNKGFPSASSSSSSPRGNGTTHKVRRRKM